MLSLRNISLEYVLRRDPCGVTEQRVCHAAGISLPRTKPERCFAKLSMTVFIDTVNENSFVDYSHYLRSQFRLISLFYGTILAVTNTTLLLPQAAHVHARGARQGRIVTCHHHQLE